MQDLNTARKQLNELDPEMKRLFLERMTIIKEIALYKQANKLAIFDAKREEAMKEKLTQDVESELLPYYKTFLEAILSISKAYQKELID